MIKQTHAWILNLQRPARQFFLGLLDVGLLFFSVWVAYAIRVDGAFIPTQQEWSMMALAPLVALPIFWRMGLYRAVIRYLSEHVLWVIMMAMTVATMLWAALAALGQLYSLDIVPRSVILLYWMFGTMLVAGARFGARWLVWLPVQRRYRGHQALIYGAGEAGRQIAATLREGRDIFPTGFLDDDVLLHGKDVNGLRVYPPRQLPYLIEHYAVREVIVALPSVSSARRREIVEMLERHSVLVRILPEVAEVGTGRNLVNRIREVDIGDLLGRDVVAPDIKLLGQSVSNRNVLVTGAGGSIGAELCRQISALNPRKLVILEQSEFALYQVGRKLRDVAACEVVALLGSVTNSQMMSSLLAEHDIQTVYHAAAYKHVPIVEENILEGCRNNVFGTLSIARAAFEAGVETFVLISSDKAVRTTNVMGATKRWAELIVQSLAREAKQAGARQRFCAVRFGNVLGSSGSVIPLFKEQIAQGGPVTVTHAEVTRYFMSIHEAVQLVIQAGNLVQEGGIFLLDMGAPVKIVDLASNMIRLSGRTVRDGKSGVGDIEIVFTGLRPGEKLYEELLIASGNAEGTSHPKIMRAVEPSISWETLQGDLNQLREMIQAGDTHGTRTLLMQRALSITQSEPELPQTDVPMAMAPAAQVLPLKRGNRLQGGVMQNSDDSLSGLG
jgi:FlaA1/EpsC-like NDP-sugar epimerase